MVSAEFKLANSESTGTPNPRLSNARTSAACRLCNAAQVKTIYEGPIRSGGATSNYESGFTVKECAACGVAFLNPFPDQLREYYESERYWVNHHGNTHVESLRRKLEPEQLRWLSEIGISVLRGKKVADFGCGAGIFLDLIRGVADDTIGVDLAEHFRVHLEQSGHQYFRHGNDMEEDSVDVAVSFDTLEHSDDPTEFLNSIYRCLRFDGHLFVGVPNQNDFLKQIVPAYLPFFYHRSHLFYFNDRTLIKTLKKIGFRDCCVRFVHKYDLMNAMVWARDGKGQGVKGSDLFDRTTEDSFRLDLERQGISSHILVSAKK